jgi:hypothetical protein
MRRYRTLTPIRAFLPLLAGLLMVGLTGGAGGAGEPGLRALIVGGGPEPEANQVAIERNVHYVSKVLPAGAPRVTLFADGDATSKTVLYEEKPRQLPPGERAFALLFGTREEASPSLLKFRAPALGKLDGPARRPAIATAFERLRRDDPGAVLLYFTGHGSRARDGNLDNNDFDLWGAQEKLSVRDLAAHIAGLPVDVPVTLVMVQCFAGAFGNVLFTGGDPKAAPVDRPITGFFAATRERMAAGCTPEVNEAEYHDFTSYFFAALTGRDRVGRPVKGADYDRDGRVGMNEAYAYSLIHDISIDVPVCTSDVFLRRAVTAADEELFKIPFSQARAWATPAQGAALDALSQALKLSGDGRLGEAYRMMVEGTPSAGRRTEMVQAMSHFNETRRAARRTLTARFPELRQRVARGYKEARKQAIDALERRAGEGQLRELFAAEEALAKAEEQEYQSELTEARVLRFVRLSKSVVLAHRLRESGDAAMRQRFERLVTAEAGPLVPPVAVAIRPR